MTVRIEPVTAARWEDLVSVFGDNGAYDGCWCVWPMVTGREYGEGRGAGNRARMEGLVREGEEPGLLAYDGDVPVGWVAVGPRLRYGRILRSPLFKPPDPEDASVWAVVCFYVPRPHRRGGLTDELLAGAVEYATAHRARSIEGYPIVPGDRASAQLFVGVPSLFERHGFTEVAAPSEARRLYRRES